MTDRSVNSNERISCISTPNSTDAHAAGSDGIRPRSPSSSTPATNITGATAESISITSRGDRTDAFQSFSRNFSPTTTSPPRQSLLPSQAEPRPNALFHGINHDENIDAPFHGSQASGANEYISSMPLYPLSLRNNFNDTVGVQPGQLHATYTNDHDKSLPGKSFGMRPQSYTSRYADSYRSPYSSIRNVKRRTRVLAVICGPADPDLRAQTRTTIPSLTYSITPTFSRMPTRTPHPHAQHSPV